MSKQRFVWVNSAVIAFGTIYMRIMIPVVRWLTPYTSRLVMAVTKLLRIG